MYNYKFLITGERGIKCKEWQAEHKNVCLNGDDLSGRWTYGFVPKPDCVHVHVECSCGDRIDLTRYSHE